VLSAIPARAHDADDFNAAAIARYKAEGTYDERLARTLNLEQHKMSEGRRQRAFYKIRRAALEASGMTAAEIAETLSSGPQMAFPFTAQPELKSAGTAKTLTILIDFKDLRAATELPSLTVQAINDNIYGTGTADAATFKPHDSLHNYYSRASQGLVNVQGNVLGWHEFPKNRSEYEPQKAPATLPPAQRRQVQAAFDNTANFRLISGALDAYDATHDFAQYDNDNDGDIDLVTILYAGPRGGWGSFWWAYRWEFFIPEASTKTFDGKRLKQFVFQFVDTRGPNGRDYNPTTLLHEMGHAFGLADYYDYAPGTGPDGGVGGLDMMHANQGNHCAFSRWLLDWIKPTVIGSGPPVNRQLIASGADANTNKAVAIFPGLATNNSPGQEMFIIENRHRVGNDAKLPGTGLLIWHIDASVNGDGSDFANDNSYTDRKLIKLIRADSEEDFGNGVFASQSTYFTTGKQFAPTSIPSSKAYNGASTGVTVDQISAAGETVTARVGFVSTMNPAPMPALALAPEATVAEVAAADLVQKLATPGAVVDLDLIEALDRALFSATPNQLQEYWEALIHKKAAGAATGSTKVTMKLLVSHMAAKKGATAIGVLVHLSNDDALVREVLPRTLEAWARQDPVGAGRWYFDDENRKYLNERKLKANETFTHEVFEHNYKIDAHAVMTDLEKLDDASEIVGALKGLRHASQQVPGGPEKLKANLEGLKQKSQTFKATEKFLESIDAARNALQEINDPVERARLMKSLQGKGQ
jgi:M6 family metalloprotease domain